MQQKSKILKIVKSKTLQSNKANKMQVKAKEGLVRSLSEHSNNNRFYLAIIK